MSEKMFEKQSEFKVVDEPKDKPENELASLQSRWLEALMSNMNRGFSTVLKIRQNGADRFFYVIRRGARTVEPLKTSETFLLLRDDFEVYSVVRTTTLNSFGMGGSVNHSFSKADPERLGFSGTFVGQLVKRVIEKRD